MYDAIEFPPTESVPVHDLKEGDRVFFCAQCYFILKAIKEDYAVRLWLATDATADADWKPVFKPDQMMERIVVAPP